MSKDKIRRSGITAAALTLCIAVSAAAFLYAAGAPETERAQMTESELQPVTETECSEDEERMLVLESAKTGDVYASYPVRLGDTFGIGFIHSVNKSPVTDWYEVRSDGIYVVKTVYYGFGAGVQTELEEGQKLTYGEDGSMIITGFDRRMDDLVYFVGTVSDHTLTLPGGEEVSLRDLCGRNAKVRVSLASGEEAG